MIKIEFLIKVGEKKLQRFQIYCEKACDIVAALEDSLSET